MACPPLPIFDGDEVRSYISRDLGFSRLDRQRNTLRVAGICSLVVKQGLPHVVALMSPYRQDRAEARWLIGTLVEVYVCCPLAVCEQRDPKRFYARAQAGSLKHLTGIHEPYEEPDNPELTLYTHRDNLAVCIDRIVQTLVTMNLLIPPSLGDTPFWDHKSGTFMEKTL